MQYVEVGKSERLAQTFSCLLFLMIGSTQQKSLLYCTKNFSLGSSTQEILYWTHVLVLERLCRQPTRSTAVLLRLREIQLTQRSSAKGSTYFSLGREK